MNKKTLILGGVLIVLIALAYVYQGPLKTWQSNLGKPNNFLAKVDTARLNKIEIINKESRINLEKLNEAWRVVGQAGDKNFSASPDLINEALAKLKEATAAELELTSTNKAKKSDFRTDDNGIKVRLYADDKPLADFIIGKTASDYRSSYLSLPEADNTYELKGVNLFLVFNKIDWRDRTIFSADKEKINKIRFQYPGRESTVEKKGGDWLGVKPYNFPVTQEKIKTMLNLMSDLSAVDIPEQSFAGTGLEKHLIIVEATGEGINNILMIGEKNKDGLYFAKRGDSDNIYLISKADRDELDKQIWQLK